MRGVFQNDREKAFFLGSGIILILNVAWSITFFTTTWPLPFSNDAWISLKLSPTLLCRTNHEDVTLGPTTKTMNNHQLFNNDQLLELDNNNSSTPVSTTTTDWWPSWFSSWCNYRHKRRKRRSFRTPWTHHMDAVLTLILFLSTLNLTW